METSMLFWSIVRALVRMRAMGEVTKREAKRIDAQLELARYATNYLSDATREIFRERRGVIEAIRDVGVSSTDSQVKLHRLDILGRVLELPALATIGDAARLIEGAVMKNQKLMPAFSKAGLVAAA